MGGNVQSTEFTSQHDFQENVVVIGDLDHFLKIRAVPATFQMCDLREVTYTLCASVALSVQWALNITFLLRVVKN